MNLPHFSFLSWYISDPFSIYVHLMVMDQDVFVPDRFLIEHLYHLALMPQESDKNSEAAGRK